jgi:hypothetical protein
VSEREREREGCVWHKSGEMKKKKSEKEEDNNNNNCVEWPREKHGRDEMCLESDFRRHMVLGLKF